MSLLWERSAAYRIGSQFPCASALPLPARRAEKEARVVRMSAFLAYHLHSSRASCRSHLGRYRRSGCRIWNNDSEQCSNYPGDKYHSAQDEVDDISHAGKNVSRQDRSKTGRKSGQSHQRTQNNHANSNEEHNRSHRLLSLCGGSN